MTEQWVLVTRWRCSPPSLKNFRLAQPKESSRGEDWQDIEEYIHLTATRPNYGGERLWLLCPACGSRRAILYGGRYFRCRACHGACYQGHPCRLLSEPAEGVASFMVVNRLVQKRLKVRPELPRLSGFAGEASVSISRGNQDDYRPPRRQGRDDCV